MVETTNGLNYHRIGIFENRALINTIVITTIATGICQRLKIISMKINQKY